MQIIRTHTFDSLYHAYRGKEQHHEEECHKQIQTHAQRMLALKRPYFKLKISCRGHAIRLLVKYYNDLDLLIPLLIADKNNRIWYNMTRDSVKILVKHIEQRVEADVRERKYRSM